MARDGMSSFDADDPEMAAAIETAKRTFGQFLETFFSRKEGQKAFWVKVAFSDDDGVEHIWVADLDGGFTTRVIRNRMNREKRAALDASVPHKF